MVVSKKEPTDEVYVMWTIGIGNPSRTIPGFIYYSSYILVGAGEMYECCKTRRLLGGRKTLARIKLKWFQLFEHPNGRTTILPY